MDGTEQIAFQTHADCSRQAGRLSSGGAPRADWSLKGRRRRLAIGRQLADRLQRVPWSAGGDVVDARARLDTNRVRQVRAGTGDGSPVGWAASPRLRNIGDDRMRYWKGSIALSPTQDYPLLQQVLRSNFVTHRQLYDLLRLDYHATSRNAFNNRVRRLVKHQYLVRDEIALRRDGYVYSISDIGASELIGLGEYYTGPTRRPKDGQLPRGVYHALELNQIHLALKRSQQLVRWMYDTEIHSRNELSENGYAKDYDAVVTVRNDGGERTFALEYEHGPGMEGPFYDLLSAAPAEGLRLIRTLVVVGHLLRLFRRGLRRLDDVLHSGLRVW